jgi:hypothetical protein
MYIVYVYVYYWSANVLRRTLLCTVRTSLITIYIKFFCCELRVMLVYLHLFFFFFFFFVLACIIFYNVLLHVRVCAHTKLVWILRHDCLCLYYLPRNVGGVWGGGLVDGCMCVCYFFFQILAECFLLMRLVVRQVLRT